MNAKPSKNEKPDPEHYLRNSEDEFSFDTSTRIYKPKAYQSEKATKSSKQMERTSAAIVINRLAPEISQSGTKRSLTFSLADKGFVIARDVHLSFTLDMKDIRTNDSKRLLAEEKIIDMMIPTGEPTAQDFMFPNIAYDFTCRFKRSMQHHLV